MPSRTALAATALAALAGTALAGAAFAQPAGRWTAGATDGRPAAEVVTLVGRDGVSANRVAIWCDPGGGPAASFARRPGLPAATAITLLLDTDAGTAALFGTTSAYGVLAIEGPAAAAAARLLAQAVRRAGARLEAGGPEIGAFGPIALPGAAEAIGRVLRACPG